MKHASYARRSDALNPAILHQSNRDVTCRQRLDLHLRNTKSLFVKHNIQCKNSY